MATRFLHKSPESGAFFPKKCGPLDCTITRWNFKFEEHKGNTMKSKSTGTTQRTQKTTGARRGAASHQTEGESSQNGEGTSAVSSLMNTLMATAHTSQAMQNTLTGFAQTVDNMTGGDASQTLTQVQDTIEHATETLAHAKETFELGKVAFESIRGTSKNVFAKVKENPEPFIAAAVPLAIGLFMMIRRSSQAGSMPAPRARRSSTQSLQV